MGKYATRRLLAAVPTLLVVFLLVFTMVRVMPGDYALTQIALTGGYKPEDLENIRHTLGLDKPFFEQLGSWLWGLAQGDLGESLAFKAPVTERLARALPVSLELGLGGFLLAVFIAIPLGVISAKAQDKPLDQGIRLFSVAGLSIPEFWTATMFILIASLYFNWAAPISYIPIFEDPYGNIRQFLAPILILGFSTTAPIIRLTRSSVLEVLREDYIRTARAKGLAEVSVLVRHALKNAMIPVLTVMGVRVSRVVAGLVLIETIFNLPGMGRLILTSVQSRDYTMIQGAVLVVAVFLIVGNLLVDLAYSWFDPRIRYG